MNQKSTFIRSTVPPGVYEVKVTDMSWAAGKILWNYEIVRGPYAGQKFGMRREDEDVSAESPSCPYCEYTPEPSKGEPFVRLYGLSYEEPQDPHTYGKTLLGCPRCKIVFMED